MSELKQRIVQAAVDNNIWLVGQLVDELEAKHEAELRKIQETVLLTSCNKLTVEALADLYKRLQHSTYTLAPDSPMLSETFCMEGPNKFTTVTYKPCCKHSYDDCIYDPAYIYNTYPNWYKDLYGDLLPEQVECEYCENGERYDDEDK